MPLRKNQAKLTQAQADEIRRLRAEDPRLWTFRVLAAQFGISQASVHNIVNNVTYVVRDRKFSNQFVVKIRQAYKDGVPYADIQAEMGVTYPEIEYLCLKGYEDIDAIEPRCTPRQKHRKRKNTENVEEVA